MSTPEETPPYGGGPAPAAAVTRIAAPAGLPIPHQSVTSRPDRSRAISLPARLADLGPEGVTPPARITLLRSPRNYLVTTSWLGHHVYYTEY